MHIRNGHLRTLAVLTGLTTLALGTGQAGQTSSSETSLVGITLRTSTFRDVMRKFGQPDEVQGGGPFLPAVAGKSSTGGGGGGPMAEAGKNGGGGMPGSAGMPGSGGGMSGGGGGGKRGYPSKSGFPGKNDGGPPAGAGGAPGSGGGMPGSAGGGMPGSAGGPAGYPGFPGSAGGPNTGGFPGSGGGGGRGLPGFPGAAGEGGPPSAAGLPGAPGSGGMEGGDAAEDKPVTEATWWYHNPRKGYHISFLFNKEGRVIQIQEYGTTSLHNGHTRQGIMLGSNMGQVLARYGWSNDGAHDGENVIMRYGGQNRVAFQMVKNKVMGITVAVGH